LWFPVFEGVAIVDPERLRKAPLPPPVVIEAVRTDDHNFAPVPNLRVGPISKELQIDYTALSFADPERVRFRYQLEGYDTEWRDIAGRRQAFYGRLPPKRYRFRVTASNSDGVWSEAGASVDITVAPAFYQTAWFQVLCVAAGGGALWSLHRVRLARIQAKLHARFEERLRERERIGRELHDTLLQNISGFALQLDGLSKTVTQQPQAAQEGLCQLRREAERCVHDARESVWDLRSAVAEEQDLCEAVHRAGEEITRDAEIQFSMAISGRPRPVPPQAQEHLLRIVQEAVRNAVRHSEATGILVDICFLTPGKMTVRISDNGIGFDLATASQRSGHWGLVTMRERAEKLGAEIRLESAPGQGTCVEIVVRNLGAAKDAGSYE
jgi:signal transduction histidine kinase